MKPDYQTSITTNATLPKIIKSIALISEWWAKDFEGKAEKQNDIFTVRFKNGDMYKINVVEVTPNKKIVWDVIDSYQGWHENHNEWNGTKIIWEIFPQKDGNEVKMTHKGLVPEFECFDQCRQGWNYLVKQSLSKLLNEGKGLPV